MNLFVLNCLFVVVQVLVLFFSSYHFLLWIVSLFVKEKYKKHLINNEHSFTFLICCHNEEIVIGDIIKSVQSLDYPTELYDIYVICDNCDLTDRSQEISLRLGARTIVRHNKKEVGKGYGVDYALNHLWSLEDFKSDGIVILDADNLVSQNFLIEANKALKQNKNVVQFAVQTKNINDSWVTRSNAISFWVSEIFFQEVREKLSLSAQLMGTGFLIRTSTLKKYGFNRSSLAEDLEFSSTYPMLSGDKIHYCSVAWVLDEKPLTFKSSWTQRKRWLQGSISISYFQSFKLFQYLIFHFNLKVFDNLIYLLQPLKMITASGLIILGIGDKLGLINSFFPYYFWFIFFVYFIFQNIYGLLKNGYIRSLNWILLSYIFAISSVLIVFQVIIQRKNKDWNPTKHTQSIKKMGELKNG